MLASLVSSPTFLVLAATDCVHVGAILSLGQMSPADPAFWALIGSAAGAVFAVGCAWASIRHNQERTCRKIDVVAQAVMQLCRAAGKTDIAEMLQEAIEG